MDAELKAQGVYVVREWFEALAVSTAGIAIRRRDIASVFIDNERVPWIIAAAAKIPGAGSEPLVVNCSANEIG
jgi:hypothetical protein